MSIKEHSAVGLFFTPSPPKESLPSLLPHSFPGGSGKGGAGKDSVLHPQQLPRRHRNSWSLPCATDTEALGTPVCSRHTLDLFNPLQTDLSRMILFFSLNLPSPNHSACNFTVQCNNGEGQVGVHGARTEPEGASLSLRVLWSGQNISPGNARP